MYIVNGGASVTYEAHLKWHLMEKLNQTSDENPEKLFNEIKVNAFYFICSSK